MKEPALLRHGAWGIALAVILAACSRGTDTAPAAPTPATGNGTSLRVRVLLAPALNDRLQPGDVVYVSARSPENPAQVYAEARYSARDLPVELVLDDTKAPAAATRLSEIRRVVVGARIAKAPGRMAQRGELEGASAPLPTSVKETIVVSVNRVVP